MTSTLFCIPDCDVVLMHGPECLKFAQTQFSNDVLSLENGQAHWNAYLNAKGRVISVFALYRISEDKLGLIVPYQRGQDLLNRLRKFVLRAKVSIELAPNFVALGGYLEVSDIRTEAEDLATPRFAFTLRVTQGRALVLILAQRDKTDAPNDVELASRWHRDRMSLGLAWLNEAQAELHTAHAIALNSVPAISFTKGCYPGQEIVARTHYLGRNPRALCLYQSSKIGESEQELITISAQQTVEIRVDEQIHFVLCSLASDPSPPEQAALSELGTLRLVRNFSF